MTTVLILSIIVLALLQKDKMDSLNFSVYGAAMLGHFYSTLLIPAKYGDYYFLSAAVLISYITYFIPKTRHNFVIMFLCGASVASSLAGSILWNYYPESTLHETMYTSIYTASVLYLIVRGVRYGFNDRILGSLRNVRFYFDKVVHRRVGDSQ